MISLPKLWLPRRRKRRRGFIGLGLPGCDCGGISFTECCSYFTEVPATPSTAVFELITSGWGDGDPDCPMSLANGTWNLAFFNSGDFGGFGCTTYNYNKALSSPFRQWRVFLGPTAIDTGADNCELLDLGCIAPGKLQFEFSVGGDVFILWFRYTSGGWEFCDDRLISGNPCTSTNYTLGTIDSAAFL